MITIQSDSRKIKPGDTFIALRGISSDGHSYIEKAIQNGATKIIAEEGSYSVLTEIVSDTRFYLNTYLKEHYDPYLKKMRLIGVTGTNGKTTTAWFLHSLLHHLGESSAYIGTIGFYIDEQKEADLPNTTVDLCDMYDLLLQAYDRKCQTVILEVSSHALAMGRIKTLAFDGAIFTNLTQDHLDYHKTMENYALAKQLLFRQVKEQGIAFVNADDPYKKYFFLEHLQTQTYGFSSSDYQVTSYQTYLHKTTFTYRWEGSEYVVQSKLIGRYNVYNTLGAIAFLHAFGYPLDRLNALAATLNPPVGRLETIHFKSNTIVIDYAHTPDAIEKIILTMKEVTKGHMYVVFGCTGDRDRSKRPMMAELVAKLTDYFIITNDDPHFEDPNQIVGDMLKGATFKNYEVCLDRGAAIRKGMALLKKEDTLLILGKGHEEVMIIGNDHVPFNDKKEVLKNLEESN